MYIELKHMELQAAGAEGSAMSHSMAAVQQNLVALNQELQAMIEQNNQQLQAMTEHMNAPKRIVRGPDGRVAGVETITRPNGLDQTH
jgi:hypothetical protein